MNIESIQREIKNQGIDGWLFYDFHNRDAMAYRILGMEFNKFTTRRWYYFVPAEGEPVRLVSAVEATKLDSLPGTLKVYRSWEQLNQAIKKMLRNSKKIAMQYSPNNNIPYVSIVDAGTIELIRSFGLEIVSSANLVQLFEAIIDEDGYHSHLEAGEKIQKIKDEAFALIEEKI
ncbi:MAG: aminopeptidase P family protein, partial [Candidatus Marinimicrobia bacterium]|nr:aminopeptidase P family protein [Candidatus Neomarinimicrobiota bacterium]